MMEKEKEKEKEDLLQDQDLPGSGSGSGSASSGSDASVSGTAVALRPKRDAWRERYRTENPDSGEEIDDEALYGYADEVYTSSKSAYDELNSVQNRIQETMQSDPAFAALISLMATGEPFEYAIGKVVGNPEEVLEGKSLEEYRRGKSEKDAEAAAWAEIDGKRNANLQQLLSNIEAFAKENGLSEEDTVRLRQGIVEELYSSLMNEYPQEAIGQKWKGMNYDRDIAEAAAAGEAAARNEKIVAKKKTLGAPPSGIRTASSRPSSAPVVRSSRDKPVDIYKYMKEVT
jgi:hypothetical protein